VSGRAIFPAKGFRAHVGDLQTGFHGMRKMIELRGEVEHLARGGGVELEGIRVVVGSFLICAGARGVEGDLDERGDGAGEGFRVDHPRGVAGENGGPTDQQGEEPHCAALMMERQWVAWQMATATASAASSDSMATPVSDLTISCTWCFSA